MAVFGKYISGESILYKIDGRFKLISVLLLFLGAGLIKSRIQFLLYFLLVISLLLTNRFVFKAVFRGVFSFKWLIILTLILPALFLDGKTLVHIDEINLFISEEGLNSGLINSGKLILFIGFSSIFMSTTSTLEITDSISFLISPLKILRFPVDNFSLMIGISLKFIPIIFGEGERIRNAQILRGSEISKNVFKRIINTVSIIVPLLISVFKRGEEMSYSLEARYYGIFPERSQYIVNKLKVKDWFSLIFVILYISIVLFI